MPNSWVSFNPKFENVLRNGARFAKGKQKDESKDY